MAKKKTNTGMRVAMAAAGGAGGYAAARLANFGGEKLMEMEFYPDRIKVVNPGDVLATVLGVVLVSYSKNEIVQGAGVGMAVTGGISMGRDLYTSMTDDDPDEIEKRFSDPDLVREEFRPDTPMPKATTREGDKFTLTDEQLAAIDLAEILDQ